MACTPLLVEAHDAKEKARATSQAIDARFQSCLQQLLFSQYLECTNTVKATGMTGTVSVVIIGKDSRFLHYGSEAEARFNVSLTRAKALTVVLAPPSATGPLGMLQTVSARLFGRLDMASLQKSAEPVATLFGMYSGLADLDEHSWHGAHHIGHAALWKELPLALSLKRRDTEEPSCSRSAWMGSARKLAVTFLCSAIRKSEAMWPVVLHDACAARPHGRLPCRFCLGDY